MMTFSALRLNSPIIGIFTSTANRYETVVAPAASVRA